jgi:hypothetical protein
MSRASAWVGIVTRSPGAQLLGRQPEREVLGRLLEAALGGHGGVLVVYGPLAGTDSYLIEQHPEAGFVTSESIARPHRAEGPE